MTLLFDVAAQTDPYPEASSSRKDASVLPLLMWTLKSVLGVVRLSKPSLVQSYPYLSGWSHWFGVVLVVIDKAKKGQYSQSLSRSIHFAGTYSYTLPGPTKTTLPIR
jgi:hypothetical protein